MKMSSPPRELGRCMTSEIFELVADDDLRFFIHKDILVSQSQPFRDATTGPWAETTDRKIHLKDWDSDTVTRLVEFLYIGDYRYPDPDPVNSPPSPAVPSPVSQAAKAPPDLDVTRPLTPLSECLHTDPPSPLHKHITDAARLQPFDAATYDFKAVLLAHSKVYALANYKSISALRTLALSRVLATLSRLDPIAPNSPHLAKNIVDFANFVYANTNHLSHSEEPLRKLTSQFVALNLGALQTEPEVVELITSGGDFVKDVVAKVCRRLQHPPRTTRCEQRSYVARIKVVYDDGDDGDDDAATPSPDSIKEIHGLSNNILYPYPHGVSLVLEYTNVAKDACTEIQICGYQSNNEELNLDRTGEEIAYIHAIREVAVLEKITEIALVRTETGTLDLKEFAGYDGMSIDIYRLIECEGTLHLVWKTVKTLPV